MKPLILEDIIEDDDVFDGCLHIANDEFCNLIDCEPIFFYGKLIDEDKDTPYGQSVIDENKTYCSCQSCGNLFEITNEQKRQPNIKCPNCAQEGPLFNFRDKSEPLTDLYEQDIAYMQAYDDGVVLRLFKAYADYSERDYDDYTRLDYFPALRFFEYGREYYHDGQLKYFKNQLEDEYDSLWVEAENIYDDDFWIINTPDSFEYGPYCMDIKDGEEDKPLMHHLTKALSYKAFRALQRYKFKNLLDSMIFAASEFPDSSKISEVLKADYNQIIANVGEDIDLAELQIARKLYKLHMLPTAQNIKIMSQLDGLEKVNSFELTAENARKVFKYLRNQTNRQDAKKKKNQNIGRDYVDYLTECDKLAFDMNDSRVLYPTDLLKAHNHTSALIKIVADAATEDGIKKAYERYHALCEYDNGKFCVIMPQHSDDIILEGKLQSHCVGNYVERVANAEDIILFVRCSSDKDKPLYTMEIRPIMRKLDIIQCRGYKNEDPSPEIRAEVDNFLVEYGCWFSSRKPVVTDKTVRTFYKAVRKIDGKYISAWDNRTEYVPGQYLETAMDKNPDRVAVKGIHVASLEFAQKYGDSWDNVAILELEVDIRDIVVPDAKDQIRASKVKVLREVPFEEMGEWGAKRIKKSITAAA